MHKSSSLIINIFLSLCIIFLLGASCFPEQRVVASSEIIQLNSEFNPDINVNNVLVVNPEFDKILFDQQANSPIPLPAANHLMLSLLVLEQLNLDERLEISSTAIAFGDLDPNIHSFTIQQGETHLVSTLLALHMYEHSYTAAMTLVEKLAESTDSYIELMNQKAQQLEMSDTIFTNILGFADLNDNNTWTNGFNLIEDAHLLQQKSTLNDLAKLIAALNKNQIANQMLSEREHFTRLADGTMIALHHPFDQIFSSLDQGITGAWNLKQEGMSFSLVQGKQNQIEYLILITDKTKNTFAKQIVDLAQEITDYYVVTPLVTQGQAYPSYDQTREGDRFGLIFLKTINYIHPATDNFLHPAVKYVPYGPHTRPLARGTPVGYVEFTLNDGFQIQAEVGSDTSILSGSTIFSSFINSLQQNPNLGKIIIFLVVLLCIILLVNIIKLIKSLTRQLRLYRLNKIQTKLKDRMNKTQNL